MKRKLIDNTGMHHGASPSVFKNAAKLRETMTETEKKLWVYLISKPLGFKFRRQHPIAGYVLDFYCHKLKFSIEIDGEYHLSKEQKEKDIKRTNFINNLGISEIRFTNDQVSNETEKVIEEIKNVLSNVSLYGSGERK